MNPVAEKMYAKRLADVNTVVKVGVGVVIRDQSGRILFEKRRDCGVWGLPGGRVEPGESVMEAAEREIKEETGLFIHVTSLIGVYSDPHERIVTYPDNGDVAHLVDVVLDARIASGTLTCSEESEELRFFDPAALPSEVVPPTRRPLTDAVAGLVGIIG